MSGAIPGGLLDARERVGMAAGNAAAVNDTKLAAAVALAEGQGYRAVFIPGAPANYQLAAGLPARFGVDIIGEYTLGKHFLTGTGTVLQQTDATKPVIQAPNTRNGFQYGALRLSGLRLVGGQDSINADNGIGTLELDNVCGDGAARAWLYFQGQVQNLITRRCMADGGPRGIYHPGTAGTTYAGAAFFDKCKVDAWLRGQTTAGIDMSIAQQAFSCEFRVDLLQQRGDGAIFNGNWRGLRLVGWNSEYGAGYSTTGTRFERTTCNTVAANAQVTLPSTTGLAQGDSVCIQAAGGDGTAAQLGWDLVTTIALVDDATHVTLAAAPVTTCTGVLFSRGSKSELILGAFGGATPADVAVDDWKSFGEATTAGAFSEARYCWDLSALPAGSVHVRNIANLATATNTPPLYDRNGAVWNAKNAGAGRQRWRVPRSGVTWQSGRRPEKWAPTTMVALNTLLDDRGKRYDANGSALTSGRMYVAGGMRVLQGVPIFNLKMATGNTPATGPTHQWMCLLDQNGVVLAVTEDKTTEAWAANTQKPFAVTNGPYIPTADADVYVGFVITVSTTMPNVTGVATSAPTWPLNESPFMAGLGPTGLTTPVAVGSTQALTQGAWLHVFAAMAL